LLVLLEGILCGKEGESLCLCSSELCYYMEVMASAAAIRVLTSPLSTTSHNEHRHSSPRRTSHRRPGTRLPTSCAVAARRGFGVATTAAASTTTCGALRHYEGLRKSSSVDVMRPVSVSDGFDVAVNSHLAAAGDSEKTAPSRGVVTAVFERFTERAIKSVMLAQREAKALGRKEVGTEQLLLGLIAEERGSQGYLGSGLTIERAREAVKGLLQDEKSAAVVGGTTGGILGPATEVPFSHGSKRVFEAALEHSKKMGHNYIAPEHVAIALLSVDDGGASKVLDRFVLSVSSPTPPIAPATRCCLRWVTRLCPG
jgi:hypothetical protein